MTVWGWVAVGIGGFLGVALLIGVLLARILGTIGAEVTRLLEAEDPWASTPLTREKEETEEPTPSEPTRIHVHGRRSRSSKH